MFASRVKKVIEVNDGDELIQITLKKLNARQLERASEVRQTASMINARSLGGEVLKAIREIEQPNKAVLTTRKQHYAMYDRTTILNAGIESWTSKVSLEKGIEDLDEEMSTLLFETIVDLSDPIKEEVDSLGKEG